ncbi:MAG TPA: glucosamine 6-phosphate synthetase [Candidatus Sumerlaeota bacterium]|nr:glucosamine 6-phosphate synthetase [Candidatus Sumerlaeota bacterium]
MCGQAGVILGRKRRRDPEIILLKTVFTGLLMQSEALGRHASGLAVIGHEGDFALFKRPLPATQLVAQPGFLDALNALNNKTTTLLGHTRYRTCGCESNNGNNHPLRAADWIGTVNGTILNVNTLFRTYRLHRHAEVDSEFLLRLAEKFSDLGNLDLPCFINALRPVRDQISAVFVSLCAPGTTYVLHGNRPMVLRAHRKYRVIAYASETRFLDAILDPLSGWSPFYLSPMTLGRFTHEDIFHPEFHEIDFITQENPAIPTI